MTGKVAVCTICSSNYFHFARTLMDSLRRVHPEWLQYVLLVDEQRVSPEIENFEVIPIRRLPLPNFQKFLFRYTQLELNTAVKPWLLEFLLQDQDCDRVVYLDPDVFVYSRMVELEAVIDRGAAIVLTPHLTGPLNDGCKPGELDILRAGSWNLGFIAIRESDPTLSFLHWWQDRLEFDCVVDLPSGRFVDQKWCDLVPGMFSDVIHLRHDGYNVAYWNLNHRNLVRGSDGLRVNGESLRFFHFSGLNPLKPASFSKHQDRFRLRDLGEAEALVRDYCHAVVANGLKACRGSPYDFGLFEDGTPITDFLRRAYRKDADVQRVMGDNPFAAGVEPLNRPWPSRGSRAPLVTCLMHTIWRSRQDLQLAFPNIKGRDRASFAGWFTSQGRMEMDIPEPCIEPVERSLSTRGARSPLTDRLLVGFRDRLRRAIVLLAVRAYPIARRLSPRTRERIKRVAPFLSPRWLPAPAMRPAQLSGFTQLTPSDIESGLAWMRGEATVEIPAAVAERHLEISGVNRQRGNSQQPESVDEPGLPSMMQVFLGDRFVDEIPMTEGSYVCAVTLPTRPKGSTLRLRAVRKSVPDGAKESPVVPARIGRIKLGTTPLVDFSKQTCFDSAVGVNYFGYLTGELGIGQAARNNILSLDVAGIPQALIDFKLGTSSRSKDATLGRRLTREGSFPVNVVHVNADQVPLARQYLGEDWFRDRYNIGYWAWELPDFPDEWTDALRLFDEIWAPSRFVVDAIVEKSPLPVLRVPHAFGFDVTPAATRRRFGLPSDAFLFLMMYDANSVDGRKNPKAAVEAFSRAFPDETKDACLIIKAVNSESDPENFEEVADRVRGRSNVVLINKYFARQEIYDLESVCDAFLSLHRSEGFGMCLAECMYLGKPVVATNWSGNVDFMTPANSCPVDYSLTTIDEDQGPYHAGQTWAEPDIDHAARLMRRLVEDDLWRRRIGHAARRTIRTDFSFQALGRRLRKRLLRINRFHKDRV